jgi:hypothetical protein
MKGLIASIILIASAAFADSIRPAYLEMVETRPGLVEITWKLPTVQGLPSNLRPILPASFKPSSPVQQFDTPEASVLKWSMAGDPLAGQKVSIQGLDAFTMDALLRVELHDGTVIRTVLGPTRPSFDLPQPRRPAEPSRSIIWIYALLFITAGAMSFMPGVRRQGILYCAAALAAGSLCGNTIGRALPARNTGLSEPDAKRIIRGLMLNTYRAFVLNEDEAVYDALARSVDGDVLNRVFLENRTRLSFNDPESAASVVDRLDIKSIENMEKHRDGSYTLLTNWDVYGSVFHWEHVHFRCNAFKARLSIVPAGMYWKISALEILEEERVL